MRHVHVWKEELWRRQWQEKRRKREREQEEKRRRNRSYVSINISTLIPGATEDMFGGDGEGQGEGEGDGEEGVANGLPSH